MTEFKNWREIMEWADAHGYKNMAECMELNNTCWNSCGEFGRSQVVICDAMRSAETEEEREEVAQAIEQELVSDILV